MKTQLIMLDTPIIVSDESPKAGDYTITYPNFDVVQLNQSTCVMYDEKIIAGIEGLPSINWNGLEEEFGWIDVEKIIIEHIENNCRNFDGSPAMDEQTFYEGAKWGFKKAQSLNDKKFSLEDMRKAYREGFKQRVEPKTNNAEIFFNSFQQPKVFDIEVEMEEYDHDEDWSEISGAFEICKYRPKKKKQLN